MVKRNEAFPSQWLKAGDLNGEAIVATIKSACLETIKGFNGGKDQQKVVLYFTKTWKPLILNMTNYDAVADILGTDETDSWAGKIELYPTVTTMQGKTMPCVRIRKPGNAPAKKRAVAPAADGPDISDEIPF